jgi:tryptophan synthase alpha chain
MIGPRYAERFGDLAARREGAFIPFLMLGDPSPADSMAIIEAAIAAGADALELGIPFSDPVADGPVIQAAANRALAAGTDVATCWRLIGAIRERHPRLPIGLLVYANLVFRPGIETFYREASRHGVDSVLVADVPVDELGPFEAAALAAGVAPVLIVPPNVDPGRLARIAARGRGYSYLTARAGVTGDAHREVDRLRERIDRLTSAGAAPAVVGFGIAAAEQVRSALAAGAVGVIAGSALIRRIEAHRDDPAAAATSVAALVRELKAATRRGGPVPGVEPGPARPPVGIASEAPVAET